MTIEPNGKLASTVSDAEVQGNSLLKAIVSNEILLSHITYLPVRPLMPENLNIDTTKFPLVDDDQLLRTIDDLLDKLVSVGDQTKLPLADPSKTLDRVIYL